MGQSKGLSGPDVACGPDLGHPWSNLTNSALLMIERCCFHLKNSHDDEAFSLKTAVSIFIKRIAEIVCFLFWLRADFKNCWRYRNDHTNWISERSLVKIWRKKIVIIPQKRKTVKTESKWKEIKWYNVTLNWSTKKKIIWWKDFFSILKQNWFTLHFSSVEAIHKRGKVGEEIDKTVRRR